MNGSCRVPMQKETVQRKMPRRERASLVRFIRKKRRSMGGAKQSRNNNLLQEWAGSVRRPVSSNLIPKKWQRNLVCENRRVVCCQWNIAVDRWETRSIVIFCCKVVLCPTNRPSSSAMLSLLPLLLPGLWTSSPNLPRHRRHLYMRAKCCLLLLLQDLHHALHVWQLRITRALEVLTR